MMKAKSPNSTTELIKTVVYAVLIAVLVRTFAYEPFNIPSGSMKPTLLVGDYLFVSKFSYGYIRYSLPFGLPLFSGRIWSSEPKRGDVAVFKFKDGSTDYIKRIIGLPGDRIQVKGGLLHVNEQPVKLQWIDNFSDEDGTSRQAIETLPNGVRHQILQLRTETRPATNCVEGPHKEADDVDNTCVYVVPPGHYFGMGDNRDRSEDSRKSVGYIPAENLIGRAEFLFFSTDGSYPWWQFWMWPFEIRYSRLFRGIH